MTRKDWILAMLDLGLSAATIAEIEGVSIGYVRRVRRQSRRAKLTPQVLAKEVLAILDRQFGFFSRMHRGEQP